MTHYIEKEDYIIVKRHFILFIWKVIKFFFLLLIAIFIYWLSFKYWSKFSDITYLKYVFFAISFSILNYAFISFMIYFIEYYNNIIVVYKNHIYIIKSSLILIDDIEVLDPYRIMRMDVVCHWFISNILDYWNLIIEQQQDETKEWIRTFHFVPNPYKLLSIIKEQRNKVVEDRKKKYIISVDNWEEKVVS